MEPKEKKSGIQLPVWLKTVFPIAARAAGKQVKEAYAEAATAWLRKAMAEDPIVSATVEREAKKNPAIQSGLAGLHLIQPKRKIGKL